jgi:hypothetical protein
VIERLVMQDDPRADTKAALAPVIAAASAESDKADTERFSLISCQLALFPAPR